MEKLTAKELKNNLDFCYNIDGIETSITEDHELFESNLASWLSNRVGQEWKDSEEYEAYQENIVILTPEDGEPFMMSFSEYCKL